VTLDDPYHLAGQYCGEPAHCTPPYPDAAPGTPYPIDPATAVQACKLMFANLGIIGDLDTARRHVDALTELTRGLREDPDHHLAVTFPPVSADPGLIVAADIPFTSLCAHHALPFSGTFTVGYLPKPGANIVGLSKLARMVTGYAARPQVQERIANQAVTALMDTLNARGAAIALRATHSCMALRGARTGTTSSMVTVEHVGDLRTQPWRDDFTAAARNVLTGPT
jgi:GTP cyclohydrolase I